MLQAEYYVVERENNNQYPLFSCDESGYQHGLGAPIIIAESLKLRLGKPMPAKFQWVDYHTAPDPVVCLCWQVTASH